MQDLPKQTVCVQWAFVRWRKMYSTWAKNWTTINCRKQTQISEEIREVALSISWSPPISPCSFSVPYTSTFLPGPGKTISRSHAWAYIKRRHQTEHTVVLFVGDFWSSLALSCTAFTQLQKTMAFQRASFIYLSGPTRMVQVSLPPDI